MATRAWLGAAVPVAQVDSVDLGGTWAQSDTITLTINNKSLVLTLGSTVDIPTILDNLIVMLTGSGTLDTGYSYNQSGDQVGEFSKLSYTEDGSTTVTITGMGASGTVPGRPFTLSGSKSSTSGTITVNNEDTSPTGPHHFDNQDNWSGNTVPVDSDDVVFDHRARSDLLFALDNNGVTPTSITITQGFTRKIGLPEINQDETDPDLHYNEYLDTYLILCDTADSTDTVITVGSGEGPGSGRLKLDCNDGQISMTVLGTGTAETDGIPALLLKGTDTSNELNVLRGDVGVAFFDGESAHLATLNVGYVDNVDGDSSVVLGSGVDIANATIQQSGGTLVIDSATGSGTIAMTGGTLDVLSAAHASLTIDGGIARYRSIGTLTTLVVGNDGEADFNRDLSAKTVTNASVYDGAALRDRFGVVTWTNGIDFQRCEPSDLRALELPKHRTWTPTSI